MALNTTAFAPMPRASVTTATAVKPGDLRNLRRAKRRSCRRVVMVGLRVTMGLHGSKAIREPKCLKCNFMRTKRRAGYRSSAGTELGVRFRRRVSGNEQKRRRWRLLEIRPHGRQSLCRGRNIARAAFCLGATQAGTFQIIGAGPDGWAKLLLYLGLHL